MSELLSNNIIDKMLKNININKIEKIFYKGRGKVKKFEIKLKSGKTVNVKSSKAKNFFKRLSKNLKTKKERNINNILKKSFNIPLGSRTEGKTRILTFLDNKHILRTKSFRVGGKSEKSLIKNDILGITDNEGVILTNTLNKSYKSKEEFRKAFKTVIGGRNERRKIKEVLKTVGGIQKINLNKFPNRLQFIESFKNWDISDNRLINLNVNEKYITFTTENFIALKKSIIEGMEVEVDHGITDSQTAFVKGLLQYNSVEISILPSRQAAVFRQKKEGSFFRHLIDAKIYKTIWRRYGLFKESSINKKTYVNNCLTRALKTSEVLSKKELSSIKIRCRNRSISKKSIKELCLKLKIRINLKHFRIVINKKTNEKKFVNRTDIIGDKKEERIINMGLVDNHYFLNDKKTNITSWALKRLEDFIDGKYGKMDYIKFSRIVGFNNKRGSFKSSYKNNISSYELVKDLFLNKKKRFLKKINLTTSGIYTTQFHDKFTEIDTLEIDEKQDCRKYKSKLKNAVELKKFKRKNNNLTREQAYGEIEELKKKISGVCEKGGKDSQQCKNLMKKKQNYSMFLNDKTTMNLCYFDSETTKCLKTKEGVFIPYMLGCILKRTSGARTRKIFTDDFNEKGEIIYSCIDKFLNYIPTDTLLIAHNLAFDLRQIIDKLIIVNIIQKGTSIIACKAIYKKKTFHFQDSYKLISTKLSAFTKMFGLKKCEKEVMVYKLYTEKNIRKKSMKIKTFINQIKSMEDKRRFMKNLKEWELTKDMINFDHMKYAMEYCLKDCELLEQGYEKFNEYIEQICKGLKIIKIDVRNVVSIASLADKMLSYAGVYNGCYEFSGVVRAFIQRCIVGGRTMTRNNKKYIVNIDCQDFDAKSCYPSAMYRLGKMLGGFLKGIPKIIKNKSVKNLNSKDSYFVEVNIKNVPKKRAFPLTNKINKDTGVRNYSNDIRGVIYLDKIGLNDLMKFHLMKEGKDFEIVRGYYFDSGRNPRIEKVIKYLYNTRRIMKKKGNEIQAIYKLIMNSSYGRTSMKPITIDTIIKIKEDRSLESRLKNPDAGMKYIINNHNQIQYYKERENKYYIKRIKEIDNHFNRCHIGCEILSMSKRLMNEVMCLAEDLKIRCFYQDTDSLHIECGKDNILIKKVANEFKRVYKKDLIGGDLGQFDCDFSFKGSALIKQFEKEYGYKPVHNIDEDNIDTHFKPDEKPYATKTYIMGKKIYMDHVKCMIQGKPIKMRHRRLKGVPEYMITDEEADDVYSRLSENETIEFDIFKRAKELDKPLFQFTADFTVSDKVKFVRNIKTLGETIIINK